jgi:hypothetical protein
MDRAFAVFTIVALVLACNLLMFKQSKGRMWSPLWMAFSASAAAGLNLVAGLIGYTLDRHDRFVAHTSWAGHVIWSQVALGVVAGSFAVLFWRRAVVVNRRPNGR